MPEWDAIFKEQGRVFTDPHPDMKRITEMFQERDIRRILDLGCGTGRHLIYLSKCGFDMYGFDSSPIAIEIASQWVKTERFDVPIILHRMEEPFPYDDNFFDAVISIQVIHHNLTRDILITVEETERVLRSGGFFFVTLPILTTGPMNDDDDWALEKIEEGTYLPMKGPESGIPHHYFTIDEINDVFRNFNIIELFTDSNNHRCILGIKR